MKMNVCKVVAPCRAIALMMEAASTSETSVIVYQTTGLINPEDSHVHTRRHENLKSHSNKNHLHGNFMVNNPCS
jgi:hypothetical protein